MRSEPEAGSASASDPVVKTTFKELGVRAGIALQVRRLAEGASKREAQLFGAIENKGVMIGPQGPEGEPTELADGDICIVRGFTGQHEFSFVSKVLQTHQQPFVYALLAYPAQVDARQVRQSMRTRTNWPVSVRNGDQEHAGQLVDLSTQGAMIRSAAACGTVGSVLALSIQAEVEGVPTTVALDAIVCHSHKASYGDAHFTGMAFQGLSQQDRLVLHYLTTSPGTDRRTP